MTLQEMDAPALGVEERRDEAPGAGASHARPTPDPEVVAKPKRRKFTAQYRLRILEEAESCTQPGEVGRLLRREGLYSSHLTEWRRARREGSLQGLTPSKRGRKKQLAKYKLLIIDELGFVPLSKTGAELLFEVFSQRYEGGSTLVTSNLPFDEWTEVFGSERLTGALLDRLTHHVHILEMNGDSYRLNQSQKRRKPPKT